MRGFQVQVLPAYLYLYNRTDSNHIDVTTNISLFYAVRLTTPSETMNPSKTQHDEAET